MSKLFNIAGPCIPAEHYMLPTTQRCKGVMELIDRKEYFVIHAARQTGKTTLLFDLLNQLEETGNYYSLYCSLETAHQFSEPSEGIRTVVGTLNLELKRHLSLKKFRPEEEINFADYGNVLHGFLSELCLNADKPIVIFFDEIDCLSQGTLISFLRQLRSGFISRSRYPFLHSVALVGMRNVRDFKGYIRDDSDTLGSASPFNIITTSKQIRNFNKKEVSELLNQHTESTGQNFPTDVSSKIYDRTNGQPWLVNAIAREITMNILSNDASKSISPEHTNQAVETIIRRRDTHIDSLLERLKEKRVQKIIEPMILGDSVASDDLDDDFGYVKDLGLIEDVDGSIRPANSIYGEVILRVLSSSAYNSMCEENHPVGSSAYESDGKLDMVGILSDFQQVWRENSEIWVERYQYKEAAPHLVLQAFLNKIINGGGQVRREVASGTGRLDLCVYFKDTRYAIELKIYRGQKSLEKGKKQLLNYLDNLGLSEGYLVLFDPDKKKSWQEKLYHRTESVADHMIHIFGA